MRTTTRSWIGAAVLLAVACGGGDEKPDGTANMRPMGAEAEQQETRRGNRPPVVESVRFEPSSPGAGEPVRAVVEASDPDGDGIAIGYLWSVNGETVTSDDAVLENPASRKGDEIQVRVTVTDGSEESAPEIATTLVGNRPPLLKGIEIEPAGRITAGTELSVRPIASDPDGDIVDFRYTWWVNDIIQDEDGPALTTRALRRGDRVRVRVIASDGEAESESITSSETEVMNSPPAIVSLPGGPDADGVFRYQVKAEDEDGDRTLRFRLEEAPEGMTIESIGGMLKWSPSEDQAGDHDVVVVVDDSQGGEGTQRFQLTVGVTEKAAGAQPPAAPAAGVADDEDDLEADEEADDDL